MTNKNIKKPQSIHPLDLTYSDHNTRINRIRIGIDRPKRISTNKQTQIEKRKLRNLKIPSQTDLIEVLNANPNQLVQQFIHNQPNEHPINTDTANTYNQRIDPHIRFLRTLDSEAKLYEYLKNLKSSSLKSISDYGKSSLCQGRSKSVPV